MSDVSPPTQAALGDVRAGVIRNAIAENVQPDNNGIIAPFSFRPPGGISGWKRVRITNYSPYLFQVIGVPGGGTGDPPQMLQPFQQNVWNYVASRGIITLLSAEPGSPLAVPPLRFAYGAGSAAGDLLFNYVSVEWTDTPELFFGYYPVPLTGVTITAEALRVAGMPTVVPVGTDPVSVAVSESTRRVYVGNNGSHDVTVIDGNTNTVLATIPIGFPVTDVAVREPDFTNERLYVACSGTHNVTIIDSTSFMIVGLVDVGADQTGITSDAQTGKTYVSLAVGNAVAVLDSTDVHTGNIGVGVDPKGIDNDRPTGQVYVACRTSGTVNQIDEATDTVVGVPIVVGALPNSVSIDRGSNRIFVANETDDTVSVIDGATALVVATVPVGNDPMGVTADYFSGKVYVANFASNTVSVIDEATNLVVDTLIPGVGPNAVAIQPLGNKVYATITADAVVVMNGV